MTIEEMKGKIAQQKIDIERAINDDIPRKVGNRIVRMTKQNFQDEGYFGKRWQEVKRRQPHRKGHSKHYNGSDTRRKILTGRTGDLGRSIKARPDKASVTIYSDLPYSAAHNEGSQNAGRGHRTKIPKRQFLGDHPKVEKETHDIIEHEITKIINQ